MVSPMSRHAHLSIKLRYGYMMGMDVKMRPLSFTQKQSLSLCVTPPLLRDCPLGISGADLIKSEQA